MGEIGPYGWNEDIDDGVSGDEELENMLGSILDFPDFPNESLEGDALGGDWDATKSQYLGPIPMDVLMGAPVMAETKIGVGPPVFMHRPVSLIDTTRETKHMTYRFEDAAGSCILRQNKYADSQETGTFQSQSPTSVLENSGSSLAGKSLLLKSHIAKRTRSKRARPPGGSPWLLISPFFSTFTSRKTCDAKKTKEGRKKLPRQSVAKQLMEDTLGTARYTAQASDYTEPASAAQPRPTKKCTHCEITKTPQWREGPLGPKTLCNACGVRYRSGRLFPEYRPAASPTFVPSLHSNSHKKVIEMRNKGKHQGSKMEQPSMSPPLEFIPASTYLYDPIC